MENIFGQNTVVHQSEDSENPIEAISILKLTLQVQANINYQVNLDIMSLRMRLKSLKQSKLEGNMTQITKKMRNKTQLYDENIIFVYLHIKKLSKKGNDWKNIIKLALIQEFYEYPISFKIFLIPFIKFFINYSHTRIDIYYYSSS